MRHLITTALLHPNRRGVAFRVGTRTLVDARHRGSYCALERRDAQGLKHLQHAAIEPRPKGAAAAYVFRRDTR
jgi:hypothetical protein